MEKRNLIMAIVLAGVIIIAAGGTYMYYQQQSEKATVTLIIDYNGLKEIDTYEDVKMSEGATVLELLEKKTEVGTEDTEYGKMIVSINGIAQDPNSNLWWTYTINGEYAAAGAETQLLSDGDTIQWTLTAF
ncbi:MAG: DUF4430 domain-containing protein [Candidatus Methanofastidiosia archaeon]